MIASAMTPEPTVAIVRPAREDMGGSMPRSMRLPISAAERRRRRVSEVSRRPRRRAPRRDR